MTMKQFLQNPSGKSSAYFARRDLIIENLENRYYKILKEYGTYIKLHTFKDGSDFYFFFKFPSEKFGDKVMYDVIIQLIPIGNAQSDFTLSNYALKVFSNSPNFLFTYAYIYNQDGIVINWLKDKVGKMALNNPPTIKNPSESYGFEKSVYFCLLYIREHRLIHKSSFKDEKLSKKKVLDNISSCENKIKEYNKEKGRVSAEKKKKKTTSKKVSTNKKKPSKPLPTKQRLTKKYNSKKK